MPDPSQLSTVPPTVLVVDDEKNIRRTLEMVLTGEGYRVLEAESGRGLWRSSQGTPTSPAEEVEVKLMHVRTHLLRAQVCPNATTATITLAPTAR